MEVSAKSLGKVLFWVQVRSKGSYHGLGTAMGKVYIIVYFNHKTGPLNTYIYRSMFKI